MEQQDNVPAGLDFNTVPTAKIAHDALRQRSLDFKAPTVVEGPPMPWELLKATLPRSPKIFIIAVDAPIGDEAPFMRLVAELVEQLPGQYVMLRVSLHELDWAPPANLSAKRTMAGKVYQTEDEGEWSQMFRQSSPDVVLTSQIFFAPKGADEKSDVRAKAVKILDELRKKQPFPVYT